MSELLGLEHLALEDEGPTLTLSVRSGQSVAILGPAASGKTRLLNVLAGQERPGQGRVHLRGRVAHAGSEGLSRRTKVQAIPRVSLDVATEVLLTLGLHEVRNVSYGDLSPTQAVACELVNPLLSDAEVMLFDGQLDLLDPWTGAMVQERLRRERAKGRTVVFVTHRPDLAARADAVIVLRGNQVRFAGSMEELLRAGSPHTVTVSTEDQAGVKALVEPFEVSVRLEGDTMRLEAKEGQALAARLLLEGYGDVRYVVVRPPTFEEALRRI